MSAEDHVIDENGWRKVDEVLPPNLGVVLIWNSDVEDVQFAEFRMYSANRYEFLQGSEVLSIHHVTHWQYQPRPPAGCAIEANHD